MQAEWHESIAIPRRPFPHHGDVGESDGYSTLPCFMFRDLVFRHHWYMSTDRPFQLADFSGLLSWTTGYAHERLNMCRNVCLSGTRVLYFVAQQKRLVLSCIVGELIAQVDECLTDGGWKVRMQVVDFLLFLCWVLDWM